MLQFRITGRYTNGNSVPAYYLECTDFSQSGRYTREQVSLFTFGLIGSNSGSFTKNQYGSLTKRLN